MGTKAKRRTVSVELIVRRGARRRFEQLKEKTAALPVKVSWDRRRAERRGDSARLDIDRRRGDRRQRPPFTWDVSDFVVVEPPERASRKKCR